MGANGFFFAATTTVTWDFRHHWYIQTNYTIRWNLPVCALFTDEKPLIVHKHRTTATTLTALIPFCLATFPQSLVLCLRLVRLRPPLLQPLYHPNHHHNPPLIRNAKLEPLRITVDKNMAVHIRETITLSGKAAVF